MRGSEKASGESRGVTNVLPSAAEFQSWNNYVVGVLFGEVTLEFAFYQRDQLMRGQKKQQIYSLYQNRCRTV